MAIDFEPMTGRYFTLNSGGSEYRIYMGREPVFPCYAFIPPDRMRGNFGISLLTQT